MLLYFGCKDTGFILVTHSIYFTNTFTHLRINTFKYRFTHLHINELTHSFCQFRVQRYGFYFNYQSSISIDSYAVHSVENSMPEFG